MHVHILGVCGTFMAGIASIARSLGFDVSGQDQNVYPPMSTLLEEQGIELILGYEPSDIPKSVDIVVVGNAMKRGMPIVEWVLDKKMAYTSGPEWLFQHVLRHKKVIALSGTHGKTTTSSMLAWVLECAGLSPSFLIGGVPQNFQLSARLTDSEYFVIEADEYDTAFFDKRSKFVHYHPDILSINNLEFDHADIFGSIDDILFQFHCLLRMLPGSGTLYYPHDVAAISQLLDKGFWSSKVRLNYPDAWQTRLVKSDGSQFAVDYQGTELLTVDWSLIGEHNVQNALVVIAISHQLGVSPATITEALASYQAVKRRLDVVAANETITLYDDFAHHPTSISMTLSGLREHVGDSPILAILDFASFTMREGKHDWQKVKESISKADELIFITCPFNESLPDNITSVSSAPEAVAEVARRSPLAHVVMMSNRSVSDLKLGLIEQLSLTRR